MENHPSGRLQRGTSILTLACLAVGLAALSRPANAQPPGDALDEMRARFRFAPMWMPIPPDPGAERPVQAPAACYALVWQPKCQKEIGLTAEQKEMLQAVAVKAFADAQKHSDRFQQLSPAEQKEETKSWGGKPAPWRQQLDKAIRQQIEALLKPEQLQAIQELALREYGVGLFYDAKVRGEIGFSPQQEEAFRRIARERLTRLQDASLKQAEKIWALLTPAQQAQLVDVVRHQGGTSATLSLAYEVGFDPDAIRLAYPMLAEPPVRDRLKLSPKQEAELKVVMAEVANRTQAKRGDPTPTPVPDDRQQVEAILTPEQLATLQAINFRRQVVLALGYPEKQKTIGFTDQQQADLKRIQQEIHAELVPVDRELLDKALAIPTPQQLQQLKAHLDR